MSAIGLVEHELAYWDRVWGVEGELGYPVGGFEDHPADVGGCRMDMDLIGVLFLQWEPILRLIYLSAIGSVVTRNYIEPGQTQVRFSSVVHSAVNTHSSPAFAGKEP